MTSTGIIENTPSMLAARVRNLAREHHAWRRQCLNLIPSENIASPAVRELLGTDFGHRYAEGEPFQRYYCGTRFIDAIEEEAVAAAKRLFRAEHANLKPVSGALANMALFYGLTKPGDTIMTLDVPDGGHISYRKFGCAGARGLKVEKIPFNPINMVVDVETLCRQITSIKPKMVLFGGSVMLFPHRLQEACEAVESYGGFVGYDAAHVLGLIAGGVFQDPLREGAHVITASTHKTFPGPQGGIILCRESIAQPLDKAVFPGLVSNHHLHRLAALTVALMEMQEFGREYAASIVRNSKALAEGLAERGFKVLCPHKGFTESHQVLINVADMGGGDRVAKTLEEANIICNKNLLPQDNIKNALNPSGVRLGTQEITRLGMQPAEMKYIAQLFHDLLHEGKSPKKVGEAVGELLKGFQTVKYCFTQGVEPYRYVEFW